MLDWSTRKLQHTLSIAPLTVSPATAVRESKSKWKASTPALSDIAFGSSTMLTDFWVAQRSSSRMRSRGGGGGVGVGRLYGAPSGWPVRRPHPHGPCCSSGPVPAPAASAHPPALLGPAPLHPVHNFLLGQGTEPVCTEGTWRMGAGRAWVTAGCVGYVSTINGEWSRWQNGLG